MGYVCESGAALRAGLERGTGMGEGGGQHACV